MGRRTGWRRCWPLGWSRGGGVGTSHSRERGISSLRRGGARGPDRSSAVTLRASIGSGSSSRGGSWCGFGRCIARGVRHTWSCASPRLAARSELLLCCAARPAAVLRSPPCVGEVVPATRTLLGLCSALGLANVLHKSFAHSGNAELGVQAAEALGFKHKVDGFVSGGAGLGTHEFVHAHAQGIADGACERIDSLLALPAATQESVTTKGAQRSQQVAVPKPRTSYAVNCSASSRHRKGRLVSPPTRTHDRPHRALISQRIPPAQRHTQLTLRVAHELRLRHAPISRRQVP